MIEKFSYTSHTITVDCLTGATNKMVKNLLINNNFHQIQRIAQQKVAY